MLVVAGLAPDLDYASYFVGASAFLRFHRSVLHSMIGLAVTAAAVASLFCLLDRRMPKKKITQTAIAQPLGFGSALAICAIGVAGHALLDLFSGTGVQLLWPFHTHWYGWDVATNFDPWVLTLLVAGLLLPLLFKLVNEEVTSGKKKRSGGTAAIVTLLLLAGYFGFRVHMRVRAVDLLLSREYHGRVALSGEAFPEPLTPFEWRGVAVTDNTIEEADVPLGAGEDFDPNSSVTRYKPEDSPQLELAEKSAAAARFLEYARLPIASVRRIEGDYRVEVRDARFPENDDEPADIFLRIEVADNLQIRSEQFLFASSPNP